MVGLDPTITKSAMLFWLIPVVILVAVIVSLGCTRAKFPRKASLEGLESPEAARAYDRISRLPQFKALRYMIVADLKKYHPVGTLVDVGCGPGYLISVIAKAFPELHVIGVDISEEMTRVASQNLSAQGFAERVEFKTGAAQKLPFEDSTIDFVVSTLSLHHWQDPQSALQEAYRVLKPEGQLLIFDLRRDSRRLFFWLLRFAQTFVVPAGLRHIGEPTGSALSSYTPAEMKALLSTMSFKHWRIKPGLGWMFIWGRKGELLVP